MSAPTAGTRPAKTPATDRKAAPAAPAGPAGPASADRGRRPRLTLALAVLLVVALAATAGVTGWMVRANHQHEQARADAARAGQTAVADLLSYDYRTLDSDLARGSAHLTEDFAKQFASVAEQSVRPVATKDKVVTTATVPAVSVTSATKDDRTVKLLAFVDQLTSSTKDENVVGVSRVEVTMQKVGDTWLIQDLRAV